MWLGVLFFTLMGAGVVIILAHYLTGGTHPWALWGGLGLITAAFVLATQWH
jgi:hypothetical protein